MVTIEIIQSCSGVDFSYQQGQRVEVTPERAAGLVEHQIARYPDAGSEAERDAAQALIDEQRRELEEKQAEFNRQMEEFAEQQRQFLEAKAAAETATIPATGETATVAVAVAPTGTETTEQTTPPATETATAPKGTGKPATTKPS